MNLNNNISNQDPTKSMLSRAEIDAFRANNTTLSKDALDDFEKDALEGWSKSSVGTQAMHNLDRKYNRKSNKLIWFSVCTMLILITIAVYNLNQKEIKSTQQKQPQITLNKQDVVISKEIEKLNELPQHLQIKPEIVVSNFKTQNQQKTDSKGQIAVETDEDYFILPLKEIQPYSIKPKLSLDKKHAKEVYLNDFKLVDYRSYRSKPEIQSKQITLSGTPADQGNNTIESESTAWKSIDIPYHDYITQTTEQFKTGNFKQTLNRTQYILNFYPDDINALFYGGLCFYNLNEIDQAIESFQKVIANPFNNFDEEALWYLANAYDLKNDKTKARELFQLISNQKGYYAKQAEKMLKK
jgi:hypothetical protein